MIPPPKLRDLTTCGANSGHRLHSGTLWEIGVPVKNSLPWSIALSYLYLATDADFPKFFRKLIGDDSEVDVIKKKKNLVLNPHDFATIKQRLKSFNPFKNRHTFFHQAKEMTDVFRIFDLRLKQYGNKLRKKGDDWNDDLKLNAASLLLECEIEVHFPDEIANQKVEIYPKSSQRFETKIILFQYENKQHGSRLESINIFRFGMLAQQANPRKLDALDHFLRKAEIFNDSIAKVKKLMENSENHGKFFLATIFQNECCDILQNIYRSPYIALKISEAGFETNPLECFIEELSAFSYSVLFHKDSKYLSILYDFASNCRCLFDHSVRKANDNVIETLKKIKSLLEEDLSKLPTTKIANDSDSVQRSMKILKQFTAYVEYQIAAASDLNNLKKSFKLTGTREDSFLFRKSIIECILTNYVKYFYCNLDRQSFDSISDKFSNYLKFSEYYKNADNFACISFFDNFYLLRLLIGLKQENVFLNIEWKILVVILFCNYFPECDQATEYNLVFDEMKWQKANVLRYVPLLHRNVLQNEIPSFLDIVQNAFDSDSLQKSLKNSALANALPQVNDVLLKIRLEVHIQAALEVSPAVDNMKSILVIERALQVIGESIKQSSSNNDIISFFLRSCLSANLQKCLIFIRNDLSHRRGNSIYGRMKIEEDFSFFLRIQKEIAQIKQRFETVFFTQFLRIEESAMLNCIEEIGDELQNDVRDAFVNEFALRNYERVKIYEEHHGKCVQLLYDTLSYLENEIEIVAKDGLISQLKSVNYLLGFILKHTTSGKVLKNLRTAVKFLVSTSENKEPELFKDELRSFFLKWINILKVNNIIEQGPLSSSDIESFYISLKSKLFSIDEENEIKEALLCAYEEAIDANNKLKELFKFHSNGSEELEACLKKIFIPLDKITTIKDCFDSKNDKALKLLEQVRFPKDQFEKDVNDMFQPREGPSIYFSILCTKITYQQYLSSQFYTSFKLSGEIQEKLEFFLTKIVRFLIARIKSLKCILIDEDEEIKETWIWGKSKEIKYHMRFLMRQRYMREITTRASLDMAYFDCVNILHKSSFSDLYEKSIDLFSGIDLRNVLSHRSNIPETIGAILDEDDFPSTMIDKMLKLIDDLEAIESTLELFPKSGILEEKQYMEWIKQYPGGKYMKQIKAIRECERWDTYLSLFPFIKN